MNVLDKRKVEDLERRLKDNGYEIKLSGFFVLSDWRGGIWISSKKMAEVDFSKLGVTSIGMHVAEIGRDGKLKAIDSPKNHF
jgi:hypothetical protein